MPIEQYSTLFEKLFARVDRPSEDPEVCWPWVGPTDNGGYGTIWWKGKDLKTHRVAFEEAEGGGDIPEGMCVCHHCDNRICCRPGHLFLGTYQDNNDDMMAKGRNAPTMGVLNGRAVLTEDQVRKIFHLAWSPGGLTQAQIGNRFGVNSRMVSEIKNGNRWPHLNLRQWHTPQITDVTESFRDLL